MDKIEETKKKFLKMQRKIDNHLKDKIIDLNQNNKDENNKKETFKKDFPVYKKWSNNQNVVKNKEFYKETINQKENKPKFFNNYEEKKVKEIKYDRISKLENFVENISNNICIKELDNFNRLNKYDYTNKYNNYLKNFLNKMKDDFNINFENINNKEYISILNQITLENIEFFNLKEHYLNQISKNDNTINELKQEYNELYEEKNNEKTNDQIDLNLNKKNISSFIQENNKKLINLKEQNNNLLNDINSIRLNLFN